MLIDHLLYAVPNLDEAADDFGARLGAPPLPGGQHEGLGTHNAILPLDGLVYVKLIASDPLQNSPDRPRPFGLDDLEGARLVTWAARAVDIESVVAVARGQGFDPGMVLDLKRAKPSGEIISWKLTVRQEPAGDGLVPFVIDWADATHPESHGQALCRLESFSAQHPEPFVVAEALAALDVVLDVEYADSVCGNGLISGPETCDDGNALALDGCSDTCSVEPGWVCSGLPSVCTTVAAVPAPDYRNMVIRIALVVLVGSSLLIGPVSETRV